MSIHFSTRERAGSYMPTPLICQGHVLKNQGVFACYDLRTGGTRRG
jgi:hypothetical protein